MTTAEDVIQREKQFLLQTYNRYPLVIERGKGVFLFDLDGKKYLDFVAGLGVIGWLVSVVARAQKTMEGAA